MRSIYIVDSLYLTDNGVQAKTQNGWFQKVHLRQGDLDGACAVYAALMVMIMIRAVKYADIKFGGIEYDGRYSIEKLKREFFNARGMHRNGNCFYYDGVNDLYGILKRNYSRHVGLEYCQETIFQKIKECIDNNLPVMIGKDYKGGVGHAVVAIGYEADAKGDMKKILCLDPGFPTPRFTYWNVVIDLTEYKGIYKYRCVTESGFSQQVRITDLLIIRRK